MKKTTKEELAEKLEERFARYDDVLENGCFDPSWADGMNLNLIRNQIIYFKAKIENSLSEDDYPEIYYRKTPALVDYEYMARANDIRVQAHDALKLFNSYFYLDELKSAKYYMDKKQLIEAGIQRSLNRISVLEKAIKEDDLVSMRRISANPQQVMKEMEQAYQHLCEFNMEEEKQISLFEMMR